MCDAFLSDVLKGANANYSQLESKNAGPQTGFNDLGRNLTAMGQTADASTFRDRRRKERVPTALRAKVFPGAVDCVIADFNDRGAKLRFEGRPAVGDHLVVVVWSSGLAFEVTVRWRAGDEAGVEFLHKRDFRRPVPAELAVIRAQWLKRRPRIRRRKLMTAAGIVHTRPARPTPGPHA